MRAVDAGIRCKRCAIAPAASASSASSPDSEIVAHPEGQKCQRAKAGGELLAVLALLRNGDKQAE
jgi:hypothetical protein